MRGYSAPVGSSEHSVAARGRASWVASGSVVRSRSPDVTSQDPRYFPDGFVGASLCSDPERATGDCRRQFVVPQPDTRFQ
jgi:hypothetical protein